jgi:superfamily I DNA and/or RNA helicase
VYGAELEIGTVDGMQGREKEAVVISLVRSNGLVSRALHESTEVLTTIQERGRIS